MGLLVFVAAAVILILLFSLYTYKICFHAPKNHTEDPYHIPDSEQYKNVGERMNGITRIMESAECEFITITAWDGNTLSGRFYEYYPSAPMLLVFHGYRSSTLRDCAGGFALGQKLGFNVLAVDQRSHGKSTGRVITFGIRERYDCLDWIAYVNNRFGAETPIILSGISMGAATVLMASELNLPQNVAGIMADCPYSSPADIICKVAGEIGYPPKLAYPLIRLGARIYGGFRVTECTAVDAVRKATVPILLIHGEDDRFVPCDMSREIYENCKEVAQLHTFPGAGHGLCYISDPRRYERICVDFLWSLKPLPPFLEKSDFAKTIRSA